MVDEKGQAIKRNPKSATNNYSKECEVFTIHDIPNEDNEDDEDDEFLSSNVTADMDTVITEMGRTFATLYQTHSKPFKGTTNRVRYGYCINGSPGGEYKSMSDVIGTHSTHEAILQMFGQYFDDGTFADVAKDVIPMYVKDANVSETSKKLEYIHSTMSSLDNNALNNLKFCWTMKKNVSY